ncbi:[protein-PII] uridylyltransferase [Histophilus somni]|uniref:Bifunctional uridylyltransferase/uridylyl-removing enzyme n=1 Tax=Histophilus somni TaxID=731 RepID=A0A9Q7E4M4_HISSO|nr:bifunctional uridylyltransferase/uridylyl-removing protein GlnD [Histophilus somni]ARU64942.1 [protein-PII] uridylyltransferase [Histophilus somni]ARU66807.1 [protein-PII] uridylyltransferase [Histophilus somni]ARU68680.1 [protein-PII] uridylyltransferase [Histophilus somni]ARU70561.1 [protein-PII] uridylyltransferase [Histophilus somni]ARU72435.1 [protein-PII] uridylyltransferase [Histophilus somni]
MFSYLPIPNPTIATIKAQKEQLKQFELTYFQRFSVDQLIHNRSVFCDQLLIHLWQFFQFEQNHLALIAVGGYGREELFPLSDLDVLLLVEDEPTIELEEKIAHFFRFLWDCGFEVGHSVRTLAQCEQSGREDITIATNLLESRYLCGQQDLFEKLTALLQQKNFWRNEDFFNAKVAEKVTRYQRYHNTGYNLEPDLKYSPGGLRDLHLIYWLALKHIGAKNLEDILHAGFIYPQEYSLLKQSQQFLFQVRFALHLILKRYDNRLLFDRQLKVCELLGFVGEGNQKVEKMMKVFFQASQSISVLSDILVKHYQEHFLAGSQIIEQQVLDSDFYLINNAICVKNPDIFIQMPDKILMLFYYLTQHSHVEIHSATLRKLYIVTQQFTGNLSDFPLARERFLRLFSQPNSISRALLPMHKYGVLNIYLPQWKGINGLMQFDLFHSYTVDEHTLRVMLKLEEFLAEEAKKNYPICHTIFSSLTDRTLLYLAALFHDIAKGRGGDHAELGAVDMRIFAQQHGFDSRESETMAWLVQRHLLMSVTAQRRDIHDPEVILNFAEEVQNKVRLDYLTCLTVADICATNETLWNSWKRSLFTTLYQYSLDQFQQGIDILLNHQEKAEENRKQACILLQQKYGFLSEAQIEQHWQDFPCEYFWRNSPKQIAWHSELLLDNNQDLLIKVSNRFSYAGTEIFIYCQDQANLFYKVASIIGAKKLSIHGAQIITGKNGYVFDSLIVTELDGGLLNNDRRRQLEGALIKGLKTNKIVNPVRINNHKLQHFHVKTEVRFLNVHKQEQTEMELCALDRAGLLAEISQIFVQLELNLLNAKISTIGEKVEDFFILTNKKNVALTEQERLRLQDRIESNFS